MPGFMRCLPSQGNGRCLIHKYKWRILLGILVNLFISWRADRHMRDTITVLPNLLGYITDGLVKLIAVEAKPF